MSNSEIKLGQAFFGSDRMGYRMLGCSSSCSASTVEELCATIGTPDGFSDEVPFFISVPRDVWIYMVCCCQGELDASGRKTLFFHALVASTEDAKKYHITAFSLFDAGLFSTVISTPCQDLLLPDARIFAKGVDDRADSTFAWHGEKVAIVSKHPENDLMFRLLKTQVNLIPWASFAFRPIPEFQLYVLSSASVSPTDRDCREASGRLLTKATSNMGNVISPDSAIRQNAEADEKKHKPLIYALVISIGLNVFLLAFLMSMSGESSKRQKKLPPVFPIENRIANWENEVIGRAELKHFATNELRDLFTKLKAYVEFVNRYIIADEHVAQEDMP